MATAMPDVNFAVTAISKEDNAGARGNQFMAMSRTAFTTTAFRVSTGGAAAVDHIEVMCAVFR